MSGPGLIARYVDALAGQLPGPLVEELADGLEETYRHYLELGQAPEEAAQAAVAEFGAPELVAAEFARVHPARRAARLLLATGPVVALLAVAARSTRYRSAGRAGAAGCLGTAALDASVIIGVLAADSSLRWAVVMAITASAARLALSVRLLRPALARSGLGSSGGPDPGLGAHLDRVPRAAQRRGVGQVQVADRIDGHAVEDGGGRDVDALGDLGVLMPEQLQAQQPPGSAVAGDPHGDAVAAGVVGLMIIGG